MPAVSTKSHGQCLQPLLAVLIGFWLTDRRIDTAAAEFREFWLAFPFQYVESDWVVNTVCAFNIVLRCSLRQSAVFCFRFNAYFLRKIGTFKHELYNIRQALKFSLSYKYNIFFLCLFAHENHIETLQKDWYIYMWMWGIRCTQRIINKKKKIESPELFFFLNKADNNPVQFSSFLLFFVFCGGRTGIFQKIYEPSPDYWDT